VKVPAGKDEAWVEPPIIEPEQNKGFIQIGSVKSEATGRVSEIQND